jgi:trk system potassium uptake protein TrkH
VRGGRRSLLAGRATGFERAVAIYGGFTMVLVVAFALAGTSGFEALLHGLTVASTGGLSTKPTSVAGLGAGAEWVAAVGMTLAGVSVAAVWWAVIGDVRSLGRSTELRAYLAAIAVTTTVIALDGGTVRGAFALAGSAASTTGAVGSTTTDSLGPGAATLLFFIAGIGAMAGSAGGGFGWTRLLHAVGFARRELVQQLHPDAVRVVKVGGRAISEPSLARTNGYITMFTMTAGLGALLVALGDTDIGTSSSISLSVAALSTSGLQTIAPVDIAALDGNSLLALTALMLLGRLAISAVVLTVATGLRRSARAARRRVTEESRR